MRKLFWILVTILAVTFSGFFGFGMNLPKTHAFTVEKVYNAPQAEVWKAITDYEYLPNWSPNITSTKRLHDLEGKPFWRLNYPYGRYMDVLVVEENPEFLHVAEIVDGNYPFTGIWRFRIVKGNDGNVLVELTEEGIIESPFWRVVMRHILGQETGARTFLRELRTHLKTVKPVIETEADDASDEVVAQEDEAPEDTDTTDTKTEANVKKSKDKSSKENVTK